MALGTPANLATLSSDLNLSAYGSSPIALTAGQLVRVTVGWYAASANLAAPTSVADDGGLNVWTREQHILGNGTNMPSIAIWNTIVAATASVTITVTFPGTQRGFLASIDAFPGASLAAPVRPDNLVTSRGGSGTTATSTLPLAMAAATHLHVCATCHQVNEATTVGVGFTGLSDVGVTDAGNSTACRLRVQYKANDTTCDPSWATSSPWALASAEIQEVLTTAAVEQTPFGPAWLVEVDV